MMNVSLVPRCLLLLVAVLLLASTTTVVAQSQSATTNFRDNLSRHQLVVLSSAQNASASCPGPYQANFTFPNTPITLFYSVLANPQGEGILKAQLVFESDLDGWLGFAISPHTEAPFMVGSLAVMGLPDDDVSVDNPGLYELSSQFLNGVNLIDQQQQQEEVSLFDKSIEQNDTHTVLTFSKFLTHTGNADWSLSPTGTHSFLVAAGISNDMSTHRYRGSARVTLEPCTSISGGNAFQSVNQDTKEALFKAHGFLMAIAWGILAPLAIGMSLNRHFLGGPLWLYLHLGLNLLVVILTTIGFGLVYKAIEDTGGADTHFQGSDNDPNGKHKPIGLAIFIIVVVQAVGGYFRPHLPHTDPDTGKFTEPLSITRRIWQVGHRLAGVALLAMAWYNCHSGVELYAVRFFIDHEYYNTIFWAVAGTLWGVILLGHFSKYIISSSNDEQNDNKDQDGDDNNGKEDPQS